METSTHAEANKYNGWTNYETWVTKLWMDNDHGSYLYWKEVALECSKLKSDRNYFTNSDTQRFTLADRLSKFHKENVPELNNVYADLINAALLEVNWTEIAESLLEDLT